MKKESCWWRYDNNYIIIYTERKTKLKYNGKPMAEYLPNFFAIRPFAVQFCVEMDSADQKALFKELGLTAKDELTEPRKKRDPKAVEALLVGALQE